MESAPHNNKKRKKHAPKPAVPDYMALAGGYVPDPAASTANASKLSGSSSGSMCLPYPRVPGANVVGQQ